MVKLSLSSVWKLTTLWWLALFVSCAPEEITFPEETVDTHSFSKSNAILSLFNEISSEKNTVEELCFGFSYPLFLKTQSGVVIEITTNEGLQELIESQTSGVYVDQVTFPITLTIRDELVEIEDEAAFQDQLSTCGIMTLVDYFIAFYEKCFQFKYPFLLVDETGSEITIASFESLLEFYANQPDKFLLDIVYPVSTSSDSLIQNDFELYRLLNECQSCPEISFIQTIEDGEIIVKISEETISKINLYSWLINDEFIKEDGPATNGNNQLNITEFLDGSGNYKVCIEAEYELCNELLTFCKEIAIAEDCPDILFKEITIEDEKILEASFEALNRVGTYSWYINDEFIEEDGNGVNGDNQLNLTTILNPGQYEVCIKAEYELCNKPLVYCSTTIIEEHCPLGLQFESILLDSIIPDDSLDYIFTVSEDFAFQDDFTLEWSIYKDNELMFVSSPYSTASFEKSFVPGTYEICVLYRSDLCPNGIEYCRVLEVEAITNNACPDLFFQTENLSSALYIFNADFEGIETLEYYHWAINGMIIEEEGTLAEGDNLLEYEFIESGSYEVCIFTEFDECQSGSEYCDTITVQID